MPRVGCLFRRPRCPKRNHSAGGRCVSLEPAKLPIIRELPGRIAPTRIAEVRARVSGIVVSRNFEQGSEVKAGDVLYRLDAEPFEIELRATEAALAKARAVLRPGSPDQQTDGGPCADARRVAIAGRHRGRKLRQAEADVAARKADVARAKLNLDHTVIRAPISGRIGRALVTEGALVGQGEVDAAGNDPAAQSDLCRLHPVGRRAQPAAPRVR